VLFCDACHARTGCRREHLRVAAGACEHCGRETPALACVQAPTMWLKPEESRKAYRDVRTVSYRPRRRRPTPGGPA